MMLVLDILLFAVLIVAVIGAACFGGAVLGLWFTRWHRGTYEKPLTETEKWAETSDEARVEPYAFMEADMEALTDEKDEEDYEPYNPSRRLTRPLGAPPVK